MLSSRTGPRDPKFPQYAYASKELVEVYSSRTGNKKVAKVLAGEWMKNLDGKVLAEGRIRVAYRGGKGFADPSDLTWNRMLEVYFLDVGQGDSVLIQTPDDRRVLIDGGQTDDAYQFVRNKYRLDKPDNFVDFEAVVATHCDADHVKGLIPILNDPKIVVKRFFHNGLFRRKDESADPGRVKSGRVFGLEDAPKPGGTPTLTTGMVKLLQAAQTAQSNLSDVVKRMRKLPRWRGRLDNPVRPLEFRRLDAGTDPFLPPFDSNSPVQIEVLWPRAEKVKGELSYRWYKDAGKTVNGNSVVLRVCYRDVRLLLAGDLNELAMEDLLTAGPSRLAADVYKAAHHGSQHFSVPLLKTVGADAAIVSSGDDRLDTHGHPRAVLMGTLTRYAKCEKPAVFCTELAACFSKLPAKLQKQFDQGKGQLYERAMQGIVHVRSDGKRLILGTTHGRKPPKDRQAQIVWKWDTWVKR